MIVLRFRIHNLTAYLQALHKEGLANEDHTILLLNCYTKLKDTQKLDEFIFKDRDSVDFDLEIAIRVCRQAGWTNCTQVIFEGGPSGEQTLIQFKEFDLELPSRLKFDTAQTSIII